MFCAQPNKDQLQPLLSKNQANTSETLMSNASLGHPTQNGNLKSLQILRFVAATSVVLVHIETNPNFGGFGVDIFFVLSGFVIALVVSNKQSPSLFAISRVSRIVPIYWLLTTLLLILIFIAPQLVHESTVSNANATNYLKSLLFIPYYGAVGIKPILLLGWTLNYEMLFYLLVWISLLFSRHPLTLASILLVALYFISSFAGEIGVAGEFFGSQLIFEFILGAFAFKLYKSSFLKRIHRLILFLVAVASYVFMAYVESRGFAQSQLLFFGIPSFLLVLSFVGLEDCLSKTSDSVVVSFFVSMGDASYSTYLTHWYVVVACRKILSERLDLYEFYSPIGIVLTVSACLFVGQITYKWADRPMNTAVKKFLTRKFLKSTPPQP